MDFFQASSCKKGFKLMLEMQEKNCELLPEAFKSACNEQNMDDQLYETMQDVYVDTTMKM